MTSEIFHLEPFEPIAADIELSVSGTVTLEGTQLTITYLLSGNLEKVAIASPHSEGHSDAIACGSRPASSFS